MRPKPPTSKTTSGEQIAKDIRRATRRHFSAEDKIRIVLDGLRRTSGIRPCTGENAMLACAGGWSDSAKTREEQSMASEYTGGCDHVHVTASGEPIDNHECHCNVCKAVTGQHSTHVAFFEHADVTVDHPEKIKRAPFNAENPAGPLEICLCTDCGAVLMLDDKMGRIRVAVPNVMGYDDAAFPKASYHAFWDETKGYPAPKDGRPVYEGLRPDFVWPASA